VLILGILPLARAFAPEAAISQHLL
jgi:hypothetical protein